MRPLLALALLLVLILPPRLQAQAMDAELNRIYNLVDKGELKRARGLFKAYLNLHPDSQAARDGYEEAGGDLAALGLTEPAAKAPAPMATAEAAPAELAKDGLTAEDVAAATLAQAQAGAEEAKALDGPTWTQRVKLKLARAGRASLVVVVLLGVLVFLVSLFWVHLQLARWHQARHQAAMMALASTTLPDGSWPADLYIELRFWSPYWGFTANSERITNAALRDLYEAGWACAKVQRQNRLLPNVPSTKLICIWLISGLSLGFLNYYSGPVLWLRRREPAA